MEAIAHYLAVVGVVQGTAIVPDKDIIGLPAVAVQSCRANGVAVQQPKNALTEGGIESGDRSTSLRYG
jgi:hypothetical protein